MPHSKMDLDHIAEELTKAYNKKMVNRSAYKAYKSALSQLNQHRKAHPYIIEAVNRLSTMHLSESRESRSIVNFPERLTLQGLTPRTDAEYEQIHNALRLARQSNLLDRESFLSYKEALNFLNRPEERDKVKPHAFAKDAALFNKLSDLKEAMTLSQGDKSIEKKSATFNRISALIKLGPIPLRTQGSHWREIKWTGVDETDNDLVNHFINRHTHAFERLMVTEAYDRLRGLDLPLISQYAEILLGEKMKEVIGDRKDWKLTDAAYAKAFQKLNTSMQTYRLEIAGDPHTSEETLDELVDCLLEDASDIDDSDEGSEVGYGGDSDYDGEFEGDSEVDEGSESDYGSEFEGDSEVDEDDDSEHGSDAEYGGASHDPQKELLKSIALHPNLSLKTAEKLMEIDDAAAHKSLGENQNVLEPEWRAIFNTLLNHVDENVRQAVQSTFEKRAQQN